MVRVGCAGWTIPRQYAASFAQAGSQLERYGRRFSAVEINSSFYRPHRRTTYERWAASVPEGFAFAVKAPKEITHGRRLAGIEATLDAFLAQATGLGTKLGPLLFQLPPSLAFDLPLAASFFRILRARHDGAVVLEPRHADWFARPADDLMKDFHIARVAADPPPTGAAGEPGGWDGVGYFRLHGTPRIYTSDYSAEQLDALAGRLTALETNGRALWCIFDNTAAGAALGNALTLQERLAGPCGGGTGGL